MILVLMEIYFMDSSTCVTGPQKNSSLPKTTKAIMSFIAEEKSSGARRDQCTQSSLLPSFCFQSYLGVHSGCTELGRFPLLGGDVLGRQPCRRWDTHGHQTGWLLTAERVWTASREKARNQHQMSKVSFWFPPEAVEGSQDLGDGRTNDMIWNDIGM